MCKCQQEMEKKIEQLESDMHEVTVLLRDIRQALDKIVKTYDRD